MLSVARSYNTPAARYIDQVLSLTTTSFIKKDLEELRENISLEEGSARLYSPAARCR